MAIRAFPVDLKARPTFEDTFGAPRPPGRTHEGIDIFAPEGTEVYAVDAGRVEFHPLEGIGGNVAYLHSTDQTRYVYSHLSAFEGEGRKVLAGDLIGYVGHTGNAATTPPHVHFEAHPYELGPINPFPALKAARDAALHPEAPPQPEPLQAQAASLGIDGIATALLFYWAFQQLGRRRARN